MGFLAKTLGSSVGKIAGNIGGSAGHSVETAALHNISAPMVRPAASTALHNIESSVAHNTSMPPVNMGASAWEHALGQPTSTMPTGVRPAPIPHPAPIPAHPEAPQAAPHPTSLPGPSQAPHVGPQPAPAPISGSQGAASHHYEVPPAVEHPASPPVINEHPAGSPAIGGHPAGTPAINEHPAGSPGVNANPENHAGGGSGEPQHDSSGLGGSGFGGFSDLPNMENPGPDQPVGQDSADKGGGGGLFSGISKGDLVLHLGVPAAMTAAGAIPMVWQTLESKDQMEEQMDYQKEQYEQAKQDQADALQAQSDMANQQQEASIIAQYGPDMGKQIIQEMKEMGYLGGTQSDDASQINHDGADAQGSGMLPQFDAAEPQMSGGDSYADTVPQLQPSGSGTYAQPGASQFQPLDNGSYAQPGAAQIQPAGGGEAIPADQQSGPDPFEALAQLTGVTPPGQDYAHM